MRRFAFLVHPRSSAREDMGKVFFPFYFVPEKILQKFIPFLNPIVGGKVVFPKNKEIKGWIIWVPLLGKQIFAFPKEFVLRKIIKAIEVAKKLGVKWIGLGEFISCITRGGKDLIGRVDGVFIDNGKFLTATSIVKAIKKISEIKKIDLLKEKIAIVGAGGSIGKGVALYFAEKNYPLILIDKSRKIKAMEEIFSRFKNVILKSEISQIKPAKIVIVATSSTENLIKAEDLGRETIVYDITQPRNTSPEILKKRKDVTIVDGGIFDTPLIDYGVNIGLKKHQAYACLAETIILTLEGKERHFLQEATPENIKEGLELLEKYKDYFKLNIFQSFGKPLNENLKPIKIWV